MAAGAAGRQGQAPQRSVKRTDMMQMAENSGAFLSAPLAGEGPLFPSMPIGQPTSEIPSKLAQLERGEYTGDVGQLASEVLRSLERGITAGMTAFPARESMEAEARELVPSETPFRNRIPRVIGSGRAAVWKQLASFGGGFGTTVDQPGAVANSAVFFGESGAPAELTSVYVDRTATYKLLGQRGSVTGLAMASGASFQDQLEAEKLNALKNLMLLEEHALINGSATSTAAPWGDGTTAFGFDGVINLISTNNGTPANNVQTSVGALSLAHLDSQLNKIWRRGGRSMYMLMNAQEVKSLKNLMMANGTFHRTVISDGQSATLGLHIERYIHPISGEFVAIIPSRFMPAGSIVFGSDFGPDGRPALEVSVLPQVALPQSAPASRIEGYVAQEIAPAWNSPQVYGFIVSVFEVLKISNAEVFARSEGVLPV